VIAGEIRSDAVQSFSELGDGMIPHTEISGVVEKILLNTRLEKNNAGTVKDLYDVFTLAKRALMTGAGVEVDELIGQGILAGAAGNSENLASVTTAKSRQDESPLRIGDLQNLSNQGREDQSLPRKLLETASRLRDGKFVLYSVLNNAILDDFEELKVRDKDTYLYLVAMAEGGQRATNRLLLKWLDEGELTEELVTVGMDKEEFRQLLLFNLKMSPLTYKIFAASLLYEASMSGGVPSPWSQAHGAGDANEGVSYVASYPLWPTNKAAPDQSDHQLISLKKFFSPYWAEMSRALADFPGDVKRNVSEDVWNKRWKGFDKHIATVCNALDDDSLNPDETYKKYYAIFEEVSQLMPNFSNPGETDSACRYFFLPSSMYNRDSGLIYADFLFGCIDEACMVAGREAETLRKTAQELLDEDLEANKGVGVAEVDREIPPICPMTVVGPFGEALEANTQGQRLPALIFVSPARINDRTLKYRLPLLEKSGLLSLKDAELVEDIIKFVYQQILFHECGHARKPLELASWQTGEEVKAEGQSLVMELRHGGKTLNLSDRQTLALALAYVSETFFTVSSTGVEVDSTSLGGSYLVPSIMILDALTRTDRDKGVNFLAPNSEHQYDLDNPHGLIMAEIARANLFFDKYYNSDHTSPDFWNDEALMAEAKEILLRNPVVARLVQEQIPGWFKQIKPWLND
jgi:hypothetical protein